MLEQPIKLESFMEEARRCMTRPFSGIRNVL